ncbi:SH3 domain-containing protein [Shimia isoporae]|uniref:SH3 domain-containing protein n=1 Tax=Shimia isoporae TaxID=647720 RepID=A0A4R1N8N8_9RHOB|nr:SH3 domain-containing protein [Shimia isoporae]TCK99920.1 SH3 domain-containing protein [Shimia isoporae]
MIRLVAIFLLLPGLLWANDLPALYDVTGVAKDDVLNVRSEPAASGELLGSLSPDATSIEVVDLNEAATWGRINLGETSGWVSMRYLQAQEPNPDYALAKRLFCYGNEPFWNAMFVQGELVRFSSPEGEYETPGAGLMVSGRGVTGLWAMGYGDSVATFRREACSDGMSDRQFGLSVALYKLHSGEISLLSGCCAIAGY